MPGAMQDVPDHAQSWLRLAAGGDGRVRHLVGRALGTGLQAQCHPQQIMWPGSSQWQAPVLLLALLHCLSSHGSAQQAADGLGQDLSVLRLAVSLTRLGPASRHALASHSLPASMQQQHVAAAADSRHSEPGRGQQARAQAPSAAMKEERRRRQLAAADRRQLVGEGFAGR